MSCWCGHGPWHHYGYGYPPPMYPPVAHPSPDADRERFDRRSAEDLESRLARLEQELAGLREELAAQRRG